MTDALLGPLAQVVETVTDVTWIERGGIIAVLVVIIFALYTGRVNSNKVVPKESYDKAMEINASYAAALPLLTQAVHEATALAREERMKNGGA